MLAIYSGVVRYSLEIMDCLISMNELSHDFDWIIGETTDNVQVKWIPICIVGFDPAYKRIIGLSSDGVWLNTFELPRSQKLSLIRKREDCYYIMAILDKKRLEIESLIKQGIAANNLPPAIYNTFPIVEILKFCLANDGGHWSYRAATWLTQEDFDDELTNIVDTIISEKQLDQKTRHYLFALMKKYKNNQR